MNYYSALSRFDPQRHEFDRYEFRWRASMIHTVRVLLVSDVAASLGRVVEAVTTELPYHVGVEVTAVDVDGFGPRVLDAYDQIWVAVAAPGPALTQRQLTTLWAFVRGGGGVYLAGGTGGTGGADADDRAALAHPVPDGSPHPILCGRDGPLTELPHHGLRVHDGHRATGPRAVAGRIVVDATPVGSFLADVERLAAPYDAVRAVISTGATPTPEQVAGAERWRQLGDYVRNIALWLARARSQDRMRQLGLLLAANHVDTLLLWHPDRRGERAYLRELGLRAQQAVRRIPALRLEWSDPVALGGAVDALLRQVDEHEYPTLPGGRIDEIARAGARVTV
jgi:hypothetical protein